jgi:hypothetical protein
VTWSCGSHSFLLSDILFDFVLLSLSFLFWSFWSYTTAQHISFFFLLYFSLSFLSHFIFLLTHILHSISFSPKAHLVFVEKKKKHKQTNLRNVRSVRKDTKVHLDAMVPADYKTRSAVKALPLAHQHPEEKERRNRTT